MTRKVDGQPGRAGKLTRKEGERGIKPSGEEALVAQGGSRQSWEAVEQESVGRQSARADRLDTDS